MITEIDYRDEKYPLGLRIELASIDWNMEIAIELWEEKNAMKDKISVLLDSQIKESVDIYKWWFSESIMYTTDVIEVLNENNGVLRGYFSILNIHEKFEEIDKYLEELLINNGISHENIWKFLSWKPWRWFYDDMIESIYKFDEEDWKPILFKNRDENIVVQMNYINNHLQEIIDYIDWLVNEK